MPETSVPVELYAEPEALDVLQAMRVMPEEEFCSLDSLFGLDAVTTPPGSVSLATLFLLSGVTELAVSDRRFNMSK